MPKQRNIGDRIKELYSKGNSYAEIVKILNCSKSSVSHHINPVTRKNIYERKAQRHRDYTQILKEERGGKCETCDFDKSFRALQFHHRIPSEKSFKISQLRGATLDTLRAEADKCALVCGNCHTMIHENLIPCPPRRK